MAATETLTIPATPNIAALNQSLAGLQAMGGEKAHAKIAALDTAWNESNNSVVATAHSLGQGYKKTLDDLARSPIKRLAADDPRIVAYDIGLHEVAQSRTTKSDTKEDVATRAAQERAAMKRLAKDPNDEQGMDKLIAVSRSAVVSDLDRTKQAKKARDTDAR